MVFKGITLEYQHNFARTNAQFEILLNGDKNA